MSNNLIAWRTDMKLGRLCTLMAAVLLAASSLVAQDEPMTARGFSKESVYQGGQIDSINLLNGTLTMSVPIGPRYPVGGKFSYGLNLVYNSNAWDASLEIDCSVVAPTPQGTENVSFPVYEPEPLANSGFGWALSLGRLRAPNQQHNVGTWSWVGADGQVHALYDRLHPNVQTGNGDGACDPNHENVCYSMDGSYLRLLFNATDCHDGSPACHRLEFPNGTFHELQNTGAGSIPDWRPTYQGDRFGNHLQIIYSADAWTLTDSVGRRQVVEFDPAAPRYSKVSRVRLTSFGNALNADGSAVYDFQYTPVVLERHQYHHHIDNCIPGSILSGTPIDVDVPVDTLSKVVQPDGTFYRFTYYEQDGGETLAGGIETARLPTGLHHRYLYSDQYGYHRMRQNRLPIPSDRVLGVKEKQAFELAGTTEVPLGTWTYDHSRTSDEGPQEPNDGGTYPCYAWTDVTDPAEQTERHFFNTMSQSSLQFIGLNGLPFAPCGGHRTYYPDWDGDGRLGPFRSVEILDANGAVLRRTFVDFDTEGVDNLPGLSEPNKRLRRTITVYEDDGGRKVESRYDDFDGLGHFRSVTRKTDFEGGAAERTVFTDYNPGITATHVPDINDPWVLGTYAEVTTTDRDGANVVRTSRSQFCFDGSNGFLWGQRTLQGDARGPHDLVRILDSDVQGNVSEERLYGGDAGSVTIGSSCPDNGQPTYRQRHTYVAGVPASTNAIEGANAVVLKIADNTIDPASGLVSASRDPSGIETRHGYDAVGRPLRDVMYQSSGSLENVATTVYDYSFPTLSNENGILSLKVLSCQPGSQGAWDCPSLLAEERAFYDRFGRIVETTVRQPWGASTNHRKEVTDFDAIGRVTRQTEPFVDGDGSAGFATLNHDFDRFGRPARVERPDHSQLFFSYQGDRLTTRTVEVQTPSGLAASSVTEQRDGFGRLVRVTEPAGTNGASVHTTYRYDQADRLIQVCVGDSDTNPLDACSGQQRTFTYDGRGWLVAETHPELEGSVQYEYDAGGNVTRKTLPDGQALDFVYDPAARMTQLKSGGAMVREYFYARTNTTDGRRRAGQLYQVKQHNPLPEKAGSPKVVDHVVTETYGYNSDAGRLAEYSVRSSQGGYFNTAFTYDQLGNLVSQRYPQCDRAPCNVDGLALGRSVTSTYAVGHLKSVPGFVGNLIYHGNGQIAELQHANGVKDIRERNLTSWKPLERLKVLAPNGSAHWDSGVFTFDPAGNITGIGGESFRYDRSMRLVSASVATAVGSAAETLTYDPFGNLATITRTGGVTENRVLSPSVATNRLPSALADYDANGNVETWFEAGQAFSYTWDLESRMRTLTGNGRARAFAYSASGERFVTVDFGEFERSYTVRGAGNQILSQFADDADGWRRKKDYVYAGGDVVATIAPDESSGEVLRHIHRDHLGSTRLFTDAAGAMVGQLSTYYPFGPDAHDGLPGQEEIRFTGHERDDVGLGSAELDYMHARYYAGSLGRFLSIDPVLGNTGSGQSWNRYTYARNNPMVLVDTDGREVTMYDVREFGLAAYQFLDTAMDLGGPLYTIGAATSLASPGPLASALVASNNVDAALVSAASSSQPAIAQPAQQLLMEQGSTSPRTHALRAELEAAQKARRARGRVVGGAILTLLWEATPYIDAAITTIKDGMQAEMDMANIVTSAYRPESQQMLIELRQKQAAERQRQEEERKRKEEEERKKKEPQPAPPM